MTTATLTPAARPVMTGVESQDASACVAMVYDVHIIGTRVMTPRCRYDTVGTASGQASASLSPKRPRARTCNSRAGFRAVATVALCWHPRVLSRVSLPGADR